MKFLSFSAAEIAVFSTVCAIWLVLIILFVLAVLVRRAAFGSRADKNPLLKYFSAGDFNISYETVELLRDRESAIRAGLYKKSELNQREELIIFCHGMGPGHIAYTTEIAYFCNLGYTVLAPDYYGCNLSDGKSISDFAYGRLTVEGAMDYARHVMPQYKKIYLVGHSWGGWAALCAGYTRGADKVVAISAPDRVDGAILDAAKGRLPKFLTVLLKPFMRFACGDKSGAKCAEMSACPVLLVHGDRDETVSQKNAVYYKAEGENIKKLLVEGAGHNPYNTLNAESELKKLNQALAGLKDGKVGEEFFKDFDFSAATEENKSTMESIAAFLEEGI